MLEIEGPLPGQGADLAPYSSPVSKVIIRAVVRDVAGLVRGDSIFSALALWHYMVMVELSLFDKATTEVTGHNVAVTSALRLDSQLAVQMQPMSVEVKQVLMSDAYFTVMLHRFLPFYPVGGYSKDR